MSIPPRTDYKEKKSLFSIFKSKKIVENNNNELFDKDENNEEIKIEPKIKKKTNVSKKNNSKSSKNSNKNVSRDDIKENIIENDDDKLLGVEYDNKTIGVLKKWGVVAKVGYGKKHEVFDNEAVSCYKKELKCELDRLDFNNFLSDCIKKGIFLDNTFMKIEFYEEPDDSKFVYKVMFKFQIEDITQKFIEVRCNDLLASITKIGDGMKIINNFKLEKLAPKLEPKNFDKPKETTFNDDEENDVLKNNLSM